jgi:hypothetical protein
MLRVNKVLNSFKIIEIESDILNVDLVAFMLVHNEHPKINKINKIL